MTIPNKPMTTAQLRSAQYSLAFVMGWVAAKVDANDQSGLQTHLHRIDEVVAWALKQDLKPVLDPSPAAI